MSVLSLLAIVLAIATAGYVLGRSRALALAGQDLRRLHSLPGHYGWHVFVLAAVPSILALAVWLLMQPVAVERQLQGYFPDEQFEDPAARTLLLADVRRVASGLDSAVWSGTLSPDEARSLTPEEVRPRLQEAGVALGSEVSPEVLAAAQDYRGLTRWGETGRTVLTIALALIGAAWAWRITRPELRARTRVEHVVLWLLAGASLIAILTTVGIVLSLLSESIRFFSFHPWTQFFFGTTWSPNFRGNSQLALLPLLWGTLYITLISMLVAVPVGLFAAVYLAEYATPRVRSVVKPLIEVIAGIPTVVFGLFALAYVGPALRDWFAEPLGLGTSGSSVMTAGLVIGILNIPFISSLADDIINAVPQSLRDGSYGLGATKSETIRQVVLPAALPGIMGAVLMAGSRAIGETMIVVMGAGAAAQMSLNPFEAMTTITVKIVSQLTGDTEFNSPETLVAFALGITLFVITLCLNILAVWIVRKYREQYE